MIMFHGFEVGLFISSTQQSYQSVQEIEVTKKNEFNIIWTRTKYKINYAKISGYKKYRRTVLNKNVPITEQIAANSSGL